MAEIVALEEFEGFVLHGGVLAALAAAQAFHVVAVYYLAEEAFLGIESALKQTQK